MRSHLLALLRYSLGGTLEPILTDGSINWQEVFNESKRQCIAGITYAGVERLSKLDTRAPGQWTTESLVKESEDGVQSKGAKVNAFKPPMYILLDWIGEARKNEKRNKILNSKSSELTEIFAKDGFHSVILKGQANAYLYGNTLSERRTPGDIDIWVDGKRKDIIKYLLQHHNVQHIQLHHADYNILDDVEIEVHFRPTLLYNIFHNNRLQKIFNAEREASFNNWIKLGQEEGKNLKVCRLTYHSDILLQLVHLYRHVLFEGIGIRQLTDFYVLITSWGASCDDIELGKEKKLISKDIKDLGLQKFTGALMFTLSTIFHINENYLLTEKEEKEGEFLLDEIFIGGNLGKFDTRYSERGGSALRNFLVITRKNMRMFTHYPSDCIWYTVYRIYQFAWRIKNGYK